MTWGLRGLRGRCSIEWNMRGNSAIMRYGGGKDLVNGGIKLDDTVKGESILGVCNMYLMELQNKCLNIIFLLCCCLLLFNDLSWYSVVHCLCKQKRKFYCSFFHPFTPGFISKVRHISTSTILFIMQSNHIQPKRKGRQNGTGGPVSITIITVATLAQLH